MGGWERKRERKREREEERDREGGREREGGRGGGRENDREIARAGRERRSEVSESRAQGVCFLGYGAAHLAIMAGRAAGMLAPVYWGDEVRARARACVRVWLRKRVKDGYGEGEKERGRAGEG